MSKNALEHYAPPREEGEVSPLDLEIKKWQKIHTIVGIPIQTSPITIPIISILYLDFNGAFSLLGLIIIAILFFALWFYIGSRLAKLRKQKIAQLRPPE